MAGHLGRQRFEPDVVLCSSAVRARQTLGLLELGPASAVLVEDGLYGAGADALLARLQGLDDHLDSVLVIGHNPGMEELLITLVGGGTELPDRFPTGALADLRLPIGRWAELRPGIARLHDFVRPRDLC